MGRKRSGGRRRARRPLVSTYIFSLLPAGLLLLTGFVANTHEPSKEQHVRITKHSSKIKQAQTNTSTFVARHWDTYLCHPERSEGSFLQAFVKILRVALNDRKAAANMERVYPAGIKSKASCGELT